jgi:hypothetical protein
MHRLGDWRGYHDLLANACRAQPNRTGFWRCLLAEAGFISPYQTVFIAGDDQANLHMRRNDRRRFTDAMRSEFYGYCGPAKPGGRSEQR